MFGIERETSRIIIKMMVMTLALFAVLACQDIKHVKLRVTFESVEGLKKGNAVTIKGVSVGKVLEMKLVKGQAVVLLGLVHPEAKVLPQDSQFHIVPVGRFGERKVVIEPGRSDVLLDYARTHKGMYAAGKP